MNIHTCSYYCVNPKCVLAQRDELRDKVERLQNALIATKKLVVEALDAFGPCDHSVGICNCDWIRTIEQADEALKGLKGE